MGVLPIVLLILAMKIPILGMLWFVFWAGRMPETEPPPEVKVRGHRPRRPQPPPSRGPRRRGPHGGGAARPLPSGHDGRVHARAIARRPEPALRHQPRPGH
ncbi:MAG TPA: hypothetical protein VGG40_04750 [Solirubrobacterales bacterium]|jgi:hypothetical protein